MADVITGLTGEDIDTEWRHERASQTADDDGTDGGDSDGTDGGDSDGTDGTDTDGTDGTDGDADGTDA
jgi:hypothetical protein